MFFTKAAVDPRFAAFFGGADLVTRLRHLTCLPEPIVFPAVALADNLARAIGRLAGSFFGHFSPTIAGRSVRSPDALETLAQSEITRVSGALRLDFLSTPRVPEGD
jgi:hypothetical protein